MVGEEHRAQLHEHLTVWQGPPPGDPAKYPSLLLELCKQACADAVIVDSLKDAAVGLSADEVGAGYNRARQNACAAGVQVLELHHLRKALPASKPNTEPSTASKAPPGSHAEQAPWFCSTANPVMRSCRSTTQTASLRGWPVQNHPRPRHRPIQDLAQRRPCLLAKQPDGLTAVAAAMAMFETDQPTANEKDKARRRLDKLTGHGFLKITQQGDAATNKPKIWAAK